MCDVKILEHGTLKVPYEILNKKFRLAQKVLDKEVSHVTASQQELERVLQQEEKDKMLVSQQLDSLKGSLLQLQSKGGESLGEEERVASVASKRVQHVKGGAVEQDLHQLKQWRNQRLDRMLVDYLLRQGYYNTAINLAKVEGLEDLTNIEVFLTAREVENKLMARDVSSCVAWCQENKSKLRKMKSSLEFQVRLQEFIELVRNGQKMEAVKHAKKFLSSDSESSHLELLQQAMLLLAYSPNTQIQRCKELLDPARWEALTTQFRNENFRLHQLSSQATFSVALQAGLASLKTPHCYKKLTHSSPYIIPGVPGITQDLGPSVGAERNPECPVCHPALNKIAANLPFAHCSQSRLVCHISGQPLNENNQPLMLPNGYVYGEEALAEQAMVNDGQVICPRTKEIYSYTEAQKVYIM